MKKKLRHSFNRVICLLGKLDGYGHAWIGDADRFGLKCRYCDKFKPAFFVEVNPMTVFPKPEGYCMHYDSTGDGFCDVCDEDLCQMGG